VKVQCEAWSPFRSVVLNLFAEGNQIQNYIFAREPQLKRFVLLYNEVLHKILEKWLKDC